jgi:hypothetical protein
MEKGKKQKLILAFDDFSQLFWMNIGITFFSVLRYLSKWCTYIIASEKELREICPSKKYYSPLFNVFLRYRLGIFSKNEAEELVSHGDFSEAEKKFIFEVAGQHPYLLQTACYILYERKSQENRGLTDAELKEIKAQYYGQIEAFTLEAISQLTAYEQKLFKDFIKNKTFSAEMQSLVDRGLIICFDNMYYVLDITMQLFFKEEPKIGFESDAGEFVAHLRETGEKIAQAKTLKELYKILRPKFKDELEKKKIVIGWQWRSSV